MLKNIDGLKTSGLFDSDERGQKYADLLHRLSVDFETRYSGFSPEELRSLGEVASTRIEALLEKSDHFGMGAFILENTLEAGGSISENLETSVYELHPPQQRST